MESMSIEYEDDEKSRMHKTANTMLKYPDKSVMFKLKRFFMKGKPARKRVFTIDGEGGLDDDEDEFPENERGTNIKMKPKGVVAQLIFGGKILLFSSKMNLMLIAFPLVRDFISIVLFSFR